MKKSGKDGKTERGKTAGKDSEAEYGKAAKRMWKTVQQNGTDDKAEQEMTMRQNRKR